MAPSPVVVATIQAAILSATSGLIAQTLSAYRENKPYTIDPTPILLFVVYTALSTPPNFFWQMFLEDNFPSTVPTAKTSKSSADSEQRTEKREKPIGNGTGRTVQAAENKLSWRNTLIKFLLDQTLGAYLNTIAYITGMAALRGERDSAVLWSVAQNDAWSLMKAGWSVWPFVSLLSFTVIPPGKRVVFGSLVGLGWGVYLSLL